MKKFGVFETENAHAKRCPICGKMLQVEGQVKLCPKHGSAPFEKKASDNGRTMSEDQRTSPGICGEGADT